MSTAELRVPSEVVRLPRSATDEQILTVVRRWADLLAAEQYDRAYGMTAHNSYHQWSPGLMRDVIEGYGLPEPHHRGPFRVSPVATATGGARARRKVTRRAAPAHDGEVGEVWFDLPLNGEWSDLTATFTIHELNGEVVLCLEEIHVF